MADGSYTLGSVFCVRAAGVPFDVLDSLGSPAVAEAGRRLIAAELAVDRAATDAIDRMVEVLGEDQRGTRRALKKLVKSRRLVSAEQRAASAWLEPYARAAEAHVAATQHLDETIDRALLRAHHDIRRHALAVLPDFAVIESQAMLEELDAISNAAAVTELRSDDRQTDRSLAMYIQRVCSKADTVSRFGPSGWGRIVDGDMLRIDPTPGITARRIEVERWVVTAVIEQINAEPEVRDELCPRLHPDCIVEDVRAEDRAALAQCTGTCPPHRIDAAALTRLADAGAIIWQLERYAVDSSPLASLLADVAGWRAGEPRTRWLARLERLRELAAAFGATDAVTERRALLAQFQTELVAIGIGQRERGRTLYSAANPISENCYREYRFELPAAAVTAVVTDASAWFDFFRDAYALATVRAFTAYAELAASTPRQGGRLSYAAFAAHARTRGVQVENDATLIAIGRETFAEIKRAFSATLEDRAHADEIELTAADCHLLRRLHELPAAAEGSYPQADLQIACASVDDFNAGRYRWVVAELHQPLTPLQHLLYWSCPDKPALHAAIAAALEHQPFAVRGALTEQPVHVAGESVFAATPNPTFVDRGRPKPEWTVVRPVDAEVIVDDAARDVRLRSPDGTDLGSLVRCFRTMMGMHPFFPFERAGHAPRLRLGNTIVQRRTWHVSSAELGEPRPSGVSASLVTGVERLRRDRGVPRWVFVRPTPGKLGAGEVFARDKDLKPFYIDLESALYLDILERRLRRYGELEMAEMLPSPEELVWVEPAGRFVFELRTSVVRVGPPVIDTSG